MNYIQYRGGYKYQLIEEYTSNIGAFSPVDINSRFIDLSATGLLTVREAYAWDGPSGPAFDTANFMRGSLEHDALYQLMCEGLLPLSCRIQADKRLRIVCREDGMSAIRAWWVYHAVRRFGRVGINSKENSIKRAP